MSKAHLYKLASKLFIARAFTGRFRTRAYIQRLDLQVELESSLSTTVKMQFAPSRCTIHYCFQAATRLHNSAQQEWALPGNTLHRSRCVQCSAQAWGTCNVQSNLLLFAERAALWSESSSRADPDLPMKQTCSA
uniref:Uncharacterized protein n=1 Tax=Rhipicephalus microplus TaxID=6941 RepID=A0A6G5AF31_RHIMP